MAQLPPKIPNMTPPHWPNFSSQKLPHFSTAAASSAVQNPSWVDEFLDFSACRRGNHRRSISDSIAFLEAPIVTSHIEEHNFDKFDDEQFMSMFTDDDDDLCNHPSHNNKNVGPNDSSLNTSTGADHKSFNDDKEPPSHHNMNVNYNNCNEEVTGQCKTEPEDGTESSNNSGDSSGNRIIDPKRVKRILANRQSAQRSRVRKLQYISELERSVTTLQSEVSVLSPRVAFLDHQRLLLNVDNSALKQRIAALAQDKIFKDAHQESLKREIERLRQVYQQQSFEKMENANHSPETGVDIKAL
ncbi:Basic leucine zipper 34 [Raphanus sativus]|uniref:Basic leucine zipper 34-like n=1 Tax=Raphanus sativus TaxID=3726 RepID=A0A6J0MRD5_RAPSA|nr:basic leucine zipper 34-like [Raphanus sativus]KAJ4906611.1 Basic leucine zipper 34 [Raphanus sativus]